jgi:hypothetical protein
MIKSEQKVIYVEHFSDCIEEPAVGVDLLLVFRLDD